MLYFAYGSNMCTARLRAPDRVPSARPLCRAKLTGHKFRFHKLSNDLSGKGDAFFTGNENDVLWGVIFKIDPIEKKKLDRAEGLGYGYKEKSIVAVDENGKRFSAVAYIAEDSYIRDNLAPYTWYKRFVVEGARQHGIPEGYIAGVEAVLAIEDSDKKREAENLRIVCDQPSHS